LTAPSLLFAAFRWGFSSRRRMSLSAMILASAGIAAGVTALIVVLGVMGGLQQGYIDSILEISSFHLRATLERDCPPETLQAIRSLPGVSSALQFKEAHLLATGPSGSTLTLNVRALPMSSERDDPALAKALGLAEDAPLPRRGALILGKEAAAYLGLDPGAEVELLGMSQSAEEGVVPIKARMRTGPSFSSGYYEFDSGLGFVALDDDSPLSGAFSSASPTIGIKLKNRFDDYRSAKAIAELLPPGSELLSWRDYNRSFFGALRTEKTMMMLLISLIFIVVGINIFHAMRRVIASKMADIAVLKACGATNRDIRLIFVTEGLTVGVAGAAVGAALGLLLCANINAILETLAGVLRAGAGAFASLGLGSGGGDYRLFSPSYFYIDKIPVSISAPELLFIAATAIASTVLAAFSAASKVSEAKPSEVFRNE
jgi:lipoprotein-releasing system permease protein